MKIAVSGKGGVGKTTISGFLAQILIKKGFKVLAIDADPNANLALTLGIPPSEVSKIIPISENAELIEEKTGAKPESYGGIFRLSFTVDDVFEKFSIKSPNGVHLLVMGTVKAAGGGCMCPANALVRSLLRHLLMKKDEAVIVDMEAGIEHLGRGTVEFVDVMLIVTEANQKSLETAKKVYMLSRELGLKKIFLVGNKVIDQTEKEMIQLFCKENNLPLIELIPYDSEIKKLDSEGKLMNFSSSSIGMTAIQELCEELLSIIKNSKSLI